MDDSRRKALRGRFGEFFSAGKGETPAPARYARRSVRIAQEQDVALRDMLRQLNYRLQRTTTNRNQLVVYALELLLELWRTDPERVVRRFEP